WGMGMATEAARACITYGFEVASYQKIGAGALRENTASLRILQKLGMCPQPRAYFDEHGGAYFEVERSTWERST
ncbi:MAG TPA: GNAT family N-acetyltransferase, partial [Ktedonobacterales bacterium]